MRLLGLCLWICCGISLAQPTKYLVDARSVPGSVEVLADYGETLLVRIDDLNTLNAAEQARLRPLPDADRLTFHEAIFDAVREASPVPAALRAVGHEGPSLFVIQFVGPIKDAWLDELRVLGVEPVHYVHHYGFLVYGDAVARTALARRGGPVQFVGDYHPFYKLGYTLKNIHARAAATPDLMVDLDVQVYGFGNATAQWLARRGHAVLAGWSPAMSFRNALVRLPLSAVAELATQPDLVAVAERPKFILNDEVQSQILAGALREDGAGPTEPGYLDWLLARGFSVVADDYPLVDVTDDGLGNGDVQSGDPTFHRFGDLNNASRVLYVDSCAADANGASDNGHGHLNANIIGGYDNRAGPPFVDARGYRRGLGVNPFARLGGTRIFAPDFDINACGGLFSEVILNIVRNGAAISSNSWGCAGCAISYDLSSQAYDIGVRDADPDTPGDQPLIFLFAAGNSGPLDGTVGTPGNGKNMITVGASENDRDNYTDGCGVPPIGADNAQDVAPFSSRGPAPGNRLKPELIAPGTHVQGTASTSANYDGNGICDQFHPFGQTLFASSSGTSHATPAVAGAASLIYWWAQNRLIFDGNDDDTPSPAWMKAYLTAHADTYLSGFDAGDDLPSQAQGYGMPNLDLAFDDTPRFLLDQSRLFDNTGESFQLVGSIADGGKPFRVALAYTDQPGLAGVNPQINNLDLEVRINGELYRGNVMSGPWSTTGGAADDANNYEAVFLPPGTTGSVIIDVKAINIAGDGVPNTGDGTDQDFALVVYNFSQQPDFFIVPTPRRQTLCAPAQAIFDVEVGGILGYDEPVSLSLDGLPSGAVADFGQTTLNPGQTTTLTINGLDTFAAFDLTLTGQATTTPKSVPLSIDIFDQTPEPPQLQMPAAAEVNVALLPQFNWSDEPQAQSYRLQLALDPQFNQIVLERTSLSSTLNLATRLEPLTLYYWRVLAENICDQSVYSEAAPFTTLELPNTFTQVLLDDNDLPFHTTTFIPDGGINFYASCDAPASSFEIDPADGVTLDLDDDAFAEVSLDQPVPFYGVEYDTLFVGSNGYVTFEAGDAGASQNLALHYSLPRIAGFTTDLFPNADSISVRQSSDRVAISFVDAPLFGQSLTHSFQIQIFFNGEIRITWLKLDSVSAIVGLSRGEGIPNDFLISDLVQDASCNDFTVRTLSRSAQLCDAGQINVPVLVGEILSFDEPVTLDVIGLTQGVTATFDQNPVTPELSVDLQLTVNAVDALGDLNLTIVGTANGVTRSAPFRLEHDTERPGDFALNFPGDGDTDISVRPTFTWTSPTQERNYLLEVGLDPNLSQLLFAIETDQPERPTIANLAPLTTYYWRVTATNHCGERSSEIRSFTTQETPNYFTQINPDDLSFSTVAFLPDGSPDFYDACHFETNEFDSDPTLGRELEMTLDASVPVNLSRPLPFYGQTYDRIFVGSNGYITFTEPDLDFSESLDDHFRLPRISGLFNDFNIPGRGQVFIQETVDRIAITWLDVREFESDNRNSFQIQMFFSGEIQITWLGLDAQEGIAGLSAGAYDAVNFIESDLVTDTPCASYRIAAGAQASYCAPQAVIPLDVVGLSGFNGQVSLSLEGLPQTASAIFSQSPVTAGQTATLTLEDLTPGTYPLVVTGTADAGVRTAGILLRVYDQAPSAPQLTGLGDAAPLDLTLSWTLATDVDRYDVVLSKKSDLSSPVFEWSGDDTQITLPGLLDQLSDFYWQVTAVNGCGQTSSEVGSFRTRGRTFYLTERFQGQSNLGGQTLTITPDVDHAYIGCMEPITGFPIDPNGGDVLNLGEDEFREVVFDQPFPFFGVQYDAVFINANGNLSFGEGDRNFNNGLFDHFRLPRISPLYLDLSPAPNSVTLQRMPDHLAITFENMVAFGGNDLAEFQIQLFHTGEVRITWLTVEVNDALVGLSPGGGIPVDFIERDVSALLDCGCSEADVNQDVTVNEADLHQALTQWDAATFTILDAVTFVDIFKDCASKNRIAKFEARSRSQKRPSR